MGPDGQLYVGDGFRETILRFDGRTGAFRGTRLSPKSGQWRAFGPDGHLYVSNTVSNTFMDAILRFDGRTGTFLNVFVPRGSGGLVGHGGPVFGLDDHLFVINNGNSEISRFDGRTGIPLPAPGQAGATFIPAGSGGLRLATELTFGPDGHLYVSGGFAVSDGFRGTILRFDGQTGAPLPAPGQAGATFIPAGSGGLENPRGLVFGPDSQLYASSGNGILRYDSRTGAFLNVFVPAGSGGLSSPSGLVFFLP